MSTARASLRSKVIGRSMARAMVSVRGLTDLSADVTIDELEKRVVAVRPRLEALARRGPVPRDTTIEQATTSPRAGEWVHTATVRDDGPIVLHLHGGAYTLCSPVTHRGMARLMAHRTGGRTYVPTYRLAPEHPHPAALDDAVEAYTWLLDEGVDPARIAVTGDSAGGGLAMALLLRLRDDGLALPACYVGLSPWVDLAARSKSVAANNGRDVLFGEVPIAAAPLLGQLYSQQTPSDHPYVSPVYGDLTGLPPMLVHVGEAELIRDDGIRLVERARAHGVDASAGVFHDMWHVFQAFPVPEAAAAFREIGGFIRRHTRT